MYMICLHLFANRYKLHTLLYIGSLRFWWLVAASLVPVVEVPPWWLVSSWLVAAFLVVLVVPSWWCWWCLPGSSPAYSQPDT